MRVARAHETLDERREVVIELFNFIRDFNGLDTTLLVSRLTDDLKFLEAAEAVLQSAVGPWKSVDALRDFAVQALYGEKTGDRALAERIRPRDRTTPFSVPLSILKSVAPNPAQFNMRDLKTLCLSQALSSTGYVGEELASQNLVNQGEMWLVTSMWARTIPVLPRNTQVRVTDQGSMRILHDGPLWAFVAEALPCFWVLPRNSMLDVRFSRQREDAPTEIMTVIEGWRFSLGY